MTFTVSLISSQIFVNVNADGPTALILGRAITGIQAFC